MLSLLPSSSGPQGMMGPNFASSSSSRHVDTILNDFAGVKLVQFVKPETKQIPEQSAISPFRSFTHKLEHISQCDSKEELIPMDPSSYVAEKKKDRDSVDYSPFTYHGKFRFNLHWYLCDDVWERHELSIADLGIFIKKADVMMLWLLGMMAGFPITTSASKPSQTKSDSVVPHGKTVIQKKITEYIRTRYSHYSTRSNKLICKGDTHVPKLPVHEFTHDEVEEIISEFREIGRSYKRTHLWRGIECVPFCIYKKFLQMVRVVPSHVYLQTLGAPWCPLVVPTSFMIGDKEYYEMDETFLIYSKTGNHLRLPLSGFLIQSTNSSNTHVTPKNKERTVRATSNSKPDIAKSSFNVNEAT